MCIDDRAYLGIDGGECLEFEVGGVEVDTVALEQEVEFGMELGERLVGHA